MSSDGYRELELWARSGAMWLTGPPDGAPVASVGSPATWLAQRLERWLAASPDDTPGVDLHLLAHRAAVAGFGRQGSRSCGGAARLVRGADGIVAVSLARDVDVGAVPALIGRATDDEPWPAIESWLATTPVSDAVARARLLGLPAAVVGEVTVPRPGVRVTEGGAGRLHEAPLVVDFSALWAGPLCAHLLHRAGADVVKVESTRRPDGARRGPQRFYDHLHRGQRSVAIDPSSAADLTALRRLVDRADVVIEASRPRALAGWGLDARAQVDRGAVWVSITAAGREVDRIGFGDDVAAGAGLVAATRGAAFAGDALADPLSGAAAAAAAAELLSTGRGGLIDVSMHDVCREAAATPPPQHEVRRRGDEWVVDDGHRSTRIQPPVPPPAAPPAAPLGAHTGEVLG